MSIIENTQGIAHRKEFVGIVKSNLMNKSIVVDIMSQKLDKIYRKYLKKTKRVMAHDEKNEAKIGDRVKIVECRPLSKRKRWRLVEILERAKRLDSVEGK